MKKSVLIVIVVVVIGAITALIIWTQRDSSDSNSNSNSNSSSNTNDDNGTVAGDEVIVTYNGNDFAPNTVTIAKGDTVVFINESNTEVWPASDDHPTHTNLGGFDPQRGLEPGEDYSFTFEESGEWGYHNHLNPGQTGVVIVE